MALYEMVFLVRQDASTQRVEALTEAYGKIVSEAGGSVVTVEQWGLRSLAYRIRKNRKAHYVLMNLDCPPAPVHEIERQMRLDEDVIRFMTLRVDSHAEGPSIQMQRRQRDDRRRDERGERGDRPPRERGPRTDAPPREDHQVKDHQAKDHQATDHQAKDDKVKDPEEAA